MSWRIVYTRPAQKDAARLASAGLAGAARQLVDVLADDPYAAVPRFEKLAGDLAGSYSRRIDRRHRLIYQVLDDEGTVKVTRMWTQYTLPAIVSGSITRRADRRKDRMQGMTCAKEGVIDDPLR